MAMSFRITCDYDCQNFAEGSVGNGTTFSLPPGWVNVNLFSGPPMPGMTPPPPVYMVMCAACAQKLQPNLKNVRFTPPTPPHHHH